MGGFTLMLHDVFVSMVMVMFFKRCFQTSSSHSCGYFFQRFVSFSSDWIDGLWIGKAVRAQLAKIQRIRFRVIKIRRLFQIVDSLY